MQVEEAWRLQNKSQKGLSDGSRSRFVMAAEAGKTEVVFVTDACPNLFAEYAAADGVFGEGW